MRTGEIHRTARGVAALALTASLALLVVGCGAATPKANATGSSAPVAGGAAGGPPASQRDAGQALATIKGPGGIVLTIDSARRQAGGFVTVTGRVKNTSDQPFTQAASWRGDEQELLKNGGSLAGATLIDLGGKKRYYVLRDTEGRCLCTTGLDIIQAGADLPVFAQFPAPPATTTQVEFQVPTLPPASLTISG